MGYRLNLFEAGECVESRDVTDPLQEIERYQPQFNSVPAPELPIFHGELAGHFVYDTVRYAEFKLINSCPPDELDLPDILLMLAEEVLIFEGLRGKLMLAVNAGAIRDYAYQAALTHLDEIEATLINAPAQFGTINLDPSVDDCAASTISHLTTQSEYEA